MILLLVSREDPASLTLRDAVLRQGDFSDPEGRGDLTVRRDGEFLLAEIEGSHLVADGVEAQVGEAVDAVLVLSRHRSEAGTPSLTVHPVGNWGPEAKYGGRPRTLVPPAPRLAAAILRTLAASPPEGYQVTYEATHHGPLLSAPTAYVELGSGPEQWTDARAADVLAEAVLAAPAAPPGGPVLLGVGGGHYAPRFTDLARRGKAAFGHILPGYALAEVEEGTLRAATAGHHAFVVDPRGKPEGLDRAVRLLRGLLPEHIPS